MTATLRTWEEGELTLFPGGPGGPFSPGDPGEPCIRKQREQIDDTDVVLLHISVAFYLWTYSLSLFTVFSSLSLGTVLTLK